MNVIQTHLTLPEGWTKGAVMALISEVAPHIGLRPARLAVLNYIIGRTRASDWTSPHREPVFFGAQDLAAVELGKTSRQLRTDEAALAKLRLLLKTSAKLIVFAPAPDPQIEAWAEEGRLTLHRRAMEAGDALCAKLFYAADEDAVEDARTVAIAKACGALVNVVDNLHDSEFITPAIVDRDPVTVAIGPAGGGCRCV